VKDFDGALDAAKQRRARAVLILSSPFVYSHRAQFGALVVERRMPTVSMFTEWGPSDNHDIDNRRPHAVPVALVGEVLHARRVKGRAPSLLVVPRELKVVALACHADGDVPDPGPGVKPGPKGEEAASPLCPTLGLFVGLWLVAGRSRLCGRSTGPSESAKNVASNTAQK